MRKNRLMGCKNQKMIAGCRKRSGVVLLVTLVLLVVLAMLAYTLSSLVSAQNHRGQYMIDYQAARYGCDSGVKYAMTQLQGISPKLISRPNEPDFSDLFHLTEPEYQALLEELAEIRAAQQTADTNYVTSDFVSDIAQIGDSNLLNAFRAIMGINEVNDPNDVNDINDANIMEGFGPFDGFGDPNALYISGPYGPQWPCVTPPIELEIGSAKVKIEIHDENAKYPVGWMLMDDNRLEREVLAGFETFCEWMDVNEVRIYEIEDQLTELKDIKPFSVEFKEVTKRQRIQTSSKSSSGRSGTSRRRRTRTRYTTVKVSAQQQVAEQAAAFSKLLHCSLIDTDTLARPTIVSETRQESPLKYIGMWGSTKVNINTAPRHVLEAAFVFGGDAVDIAQEIILRRRLKPFKDIDDLKEYLLGYSDSIAKCEKFITTESTFFTIKVTAASGLAQASKVIAVTKGEKKTNVIGTISG
jgi:hypothetical protein